MPQKQLSELYYSYSLQISKDTYKENHHISKNCTPKRKETPHLSIFRTFDSLILAPVIPMAIHFVGLHDSNDTERHTTEQCSQKSPYEIIVRLCLWNGRGRSWRRRDWRNERRKIFPLTHFSADPLLLHFELFCECGQKKKSPKALNFRTFLHFSSTCCGAYGTRTRDPMRDRHVF